MVAELLLEKETINHDDLVALIGSRPFAAHKNYLEFISAQEHGKKLDADKLAAKEESEKEKEGDKEEATVAAKEA